MITMYKILMRCIFLIQDILPLTMKNQYEKRPPRLGSRILAFHEDTVLIKKGRQTDYLTYEELILRCAKYGENVPQMVYLFAVGGHDYFLAESLEVPGEEYEYVRMTAMRAKQPKEQVFIAATAWHLYCWYRDNRYCGRCGRKLVHSDAQRMLCCPACGSQVFPKIAPAVIVAVTNGEHILMTKYANREYKRYALIAGFTEIGETAEETVRREVLEEVGLRVKNIRYYKSQPWGFDANLLLGYFCELDDAEDIHLDEEELECAEWVHYSDIEDDAEGLSLTHEMMTVFRDEKSGLLK